MRDVINKLLSLSLLILALQASTAYAIDDCSKGKIDPKVYACADKNRIEAEADLNKEYAATKSRVEYYLKSDQAEKKRYLDKLLAAQRAWLKYREYDCQLAGCAADEGSNPSITFTNVCITNRNIERIKRLKKIP
ncbi:lysozyme inhibitor LprI family protein [Erwinia pyrifoliae]|uniref:lysozyme inhibitor LprI family protein n=1 Tax=Erwinia pyrifoliae TaxID=79967 RepID=UPI00288302D4|nr:lysozyme inhibitor LprI family protein [Erwinia pyrifoliae]